MSCWSALGSPSWPGAAIWRTWILCVRRRPAGCCRRWPGCPLRRPPAAAPVHPAPVGGGGVRAGSGGSGAGPDAGAFGAGPGDPGPRLHQHLSPRRAEGGGHLQLRGEAELRLSALHLCGAAPGAGGGAEVRVSFRQADRSPPGTEGAAHPAPGHGEVRLRADSGFYSAGFLNWCRGHRLRFCVVVPRYQVMGELRRHISPSGWRPCREMTGRRWRSCGSRPPAGSTSRFSFWCGGSGWRRRRSPRAPRAGGGGPSPRGSCSWLSRGW